MAGSVSLHQAVRGRQNYVDMASELETAACTGDVQKVFDKAGVDPSKDKDIPARLNCTETWGETPLLLAVRRNHIVAIQTLVNAGADINYCPRGRETPFLSAVSIGRSLPFLQELTQLGADINRVDGLLRNAIIWAVRYGKVDVFQYLIEKGVDIHCVDFHEMNALMMAAEWGEADCLQRLIVAGAEIHRLNDKGQNAVILAASRARDKCLKLLIKAHADIHCVDSHGMNALMTASFNGHLDCVKLLIKAGAKINRQSKSQTEFPGTALGCAAERHQLKCLKLLLQAGADVDLLASSTNVPRYFNRRIDYSPVTVTECVKVLIEYGADVNKEASNGETALMILVKSALGNYVHNYAPYATRNKQTVLMQAAIDNCLVHLLPIFVRAGAVIDQQDSKGMTALAHAVTAGRKKCVRQLLECGSDVTKIDNEGQTVLMHAAMNNRGANLLPILVKAGAVVDEQDFSGMTALSHAVSTGSHECVRWLVGNGASVGICDRSGKTPLDHLKFSKRRGKNAAKCSTLLLSKEANKNDGD